MPPAGACYIGLDVGTSGCRAVAIDADGNELAAARTDLPPSSRPVPGASEQSPADWWTASIEVLGAVIEQASAPAAAIAVDGTSSTLLLCDTDGFPAGPALMYDDSRAAVQATRVGRHAPADSPAHGAGSALARLLYLLDRSDRRDGLALHQADWIAGRLLGRFGLSDENNALKLGYDPVARRWPDWIERLGIPGAMLPRVLPTGRVLGPVARDAARQLVLPTACVVVAGTTDSNAATLAAGVRRVGEAVT
jgi:sugar (pentulose or hexulose) kinase